MNDIADFRRRLASGELDESVRSLMIEMGMRNPDQTEPAHSALPGEFDAILSRARLIKQSSLCVLTTSNETEVLQLATSLSEGTSFYTEVQFMSAASDRPFTGIIEGALKGKTLLKFDGSIPGQILDFVAVTSHVERRRFRKEVFRKTEIVFPSTAEHKVETSTSAEPLLALANEKDSISQSRPEFIVVWEAKSDDLCITTPIQKNDAEELLIFVTVGNADSTPLILNRSDESYSHLSGHFPIPSDIAATNATSVNITVKTVDLQQLWSLSPLDVSLWLATQPMIAMPLTQHDEKYEFSLYPSDSEFLRQHRNCTFALRYVQRDGVAGA